MPRIAIAVLTLSITTVDVCGFVSPASPVHGGAPWAAAAAPLTVRGLTITPAIDVYPKLPTRELEVDAHAGAPPMLYVDGAPLSAQVADVDPFGMVAEELIPFAENIKHLVDSEHPVLSSAAKHFFEKRHGKRFRPTIVMLMSKAVPMADGGEHSETVKSKQAQLGQITEMIHVASLIHDDVLDDADTRRGGDSVHILFSNKVAVLAGDYLLARASVAMARLQNVEVVQIMATALDSLVAGEIMQIKSAPDEQLEMGHYLRKSYYKTASLICDACKSSALLAGHAFDSDTAKACEEFGYHLGLAFQIQDDILDFTGTSEDLGKPAMADMSLGLSTAPLLYAAQEVEELRPLIKRRFKNAGDKEAAYDMVTERSNGVVRSKELARFHAQSALDAICRLPHSQYRDALSALCDTVITRRK